MKKRKILASVMTAALAVSALFAALPMQAKAADPAPGENGYVSLHMYTSPTSDPTVWKVTQTVNADIKVKPKKVVFVLDDSGSMVFQGGGSSTNARMMDYGNASIPASNAYDYNSFAALPAFASGIANGTTSAWYAPHTFKTRWKTMVEDAVPAAIDAMWGSSVEKSTAEKIEISLVTFGSSSSVIKKLGGFMNYDNSAALTGTTPAISSSSGNGAADLTNWVKGLTCASSGTDMSVGLNGAITLFGTYDPDYEYYVLALTDGENSTPQADTDTINAADQLKNQYNAEIWTVKMNLDPATVSQTPPLTVDEFLRDKIATTPSTYHPCYTQVAAMEAFAAFGDKVKGASGVSANMGINQSAFDIYKMPGQPLLSVSQSDGGSDSTATYANGKIDWTFTGALKSSVTYTLVYYVKSVAGATPGAYYPVLSSNTFSYTYTDSSGTVVNMTKSFPTISISPSDGETKKEEAADATTTSKTETKTSTALLPITGSTGTLKSKAIPVINGVSSKTLTNGRTQVSCDVVDGSDFYYQWQYQNDKNEWVDISGANSSIYTLGAPLKVGQTYKVRCVVMNSRGTKTISETLEVKRTNSKLSSETLQASK